MSGRFFGKPKNPPREQEKALKSEAQERGELKQAPESDTAYAAKRVAKP
jgi:Na+-transporting methylmalonyl-CoA/oxaloacetate decarboxylase gamma subunit